MIPLLGFGTWRLKGREAYDGVRDALDVGYRQVDTARFYGNEAEVGRALADAGIDDVFVVTKLWTDELEPAHVPKAVTDSLRKLGHIDLLLVHWPNEDVPVQATIEAMRAEQDAGRVASIGVSNFPTKLLREAARYATIATNQVEYHPFLDQTQVLDTCRELGVTLTAYSPLARGRVEDDTTIQTIASAHGKTPSQVALRWLIQQDGVIAIPKSASPERRRENFDIFDFELSADEMEAISGLARGQRLVDIGIDWDA